MRLLHILYCITLLGYILGIHDGHVALWKDGVPVQIYPCAVASLPEPDQQLLEQGLPINSISDLTERLEDYLS